MNFNCFNAILFFINQLLYLYRLSRTRTQQQQYHLLTSIHVTENHTSLLKVEICGHIRIASSTHTAEAWRILEHECRAGIRIYRRTSTVIQLQIGTGRSFPYGNRFGQFTYIQSPYTCILYRNLKRHSEHKAMT